MKVGVMASGRGSNFHAILKEARNGNLPNVEIKHLIVNKRKAKAIEVAKEYDIPYTIIESKNKTRNDFERKVLDLFKIENIEIVVLAGFMRILTARFIKHYKNRIINIHPSLLPAFPGAHAHRDAINSGVKESGCTVHFVNEGVDSGPIIMQAAVDIADGESEESLSSKILTKEHLIFPKTLELLCSNKIEIIGQNVKINPD
ncbi:MAG: phosphoribosylglycinamide formyltransferase [Marine Group III euryarchaeote CG-Epi2]|uniref:phosphoribosylglycinamide formyltransferase 1 n=1 Tax=Marine Group III euryarchaeote CG-Epi2 TaxID=1888996 RepID=A0A1J5TNF4_9ARCH|nr:MAG: phosphoribosylglycinamide formyltransferase [Marine Group III euryarchaeote CG-Epi2]